MIDRVSGLGGGHVMRLGADAANAVRQQRHLFNRTPNAESFEAAQFGNLEVGVGDVAVLIEEDLDLAVTFKAGDGVCESASSGCANCSSSGSRARASRATFRS